MNQDQIERDRLITEIHGMCKSSKEWQEKHDTDDDKRFKNVNDKINYGIWMLVCCAIIVVANGGMSAIKNIFMVAK